MGFLFMFVGFALLGGKLLEVGPFQDISWLWAGLPLAMAAAWWSWADSSGLTKRQEMQKMQDKKTNRINKQRADLGLSDKGKRH